MRLVMAQTSDAQDKAREEVYNALRTYTAQVKGPYFLGEKFSLVDIAIVPWIVRDYIIAEHRGYDRAAVSQEWKKYAEVAESRDSVLKVQSVSSRQIGFDYSNSLTVVVFSASIGQRALHRDLWSIPAR